MAYQFFHVESYARVAGKDKAGGHSVQSILAEAKREAGACPHVANPQAPAVHFGDLNEVEKAANEWAENSVDAIGRKIRKDGHCLLAGVFSAPDDLTEAEWADYRSQSIDWLRARFGERLRCVIEHKDEAKRHCHFYAVARLGERFEVLHAGKAAALNAKAAGKKKGDQNRAYKEAMRELQTQFWGVSRKFGLGRIGPARRRLTRAQWKQEQINAKLLKDASEEAKRILAEADKVTQAAAEKEKKAKQQTRLWNAAAAECKGERAAFAEEIKESKRPWVVFGAKIGALFAGAKISYKRQTARLRQILRKHSLLQQLEEERKQAEALREDNRLKSEREAMARNKLAVAEERANKAEARANNAETALVDYKRRVKEAIEKSGRKNNTGSTQKTPKTY